MLSSDSKNLFKPGATMF